MFEVGDIVVCIDNGSYNIDLILNKLYYVDKVIGHRILSDNDDSDYFIFLKGSKQSYFAYRFEKLENNRFKKLKKLKECLK